MTGRKGRVVRRPDGIVRYESRAEQGLTIDHINLKEKDRFMGGEKVRNVQHLLRLEPVLVLSPELSPHIEILKLSFPAGGHHLRGSQLWNFSAGRQEGEKPETSSPHDSRAAVECGQGYSAVW